MATVRDLIGTVAAEVGNTSGAKYWNYCREHYFPWMGAYVNGSITPYCAAFVSWGLGATGTACEGFPSLQAFDTSWRANGRRVEAYDLQRGDVINFDWDGGGGDHVGFVEERLDAGYYMTIEGNASNAVRRCWRDASVILYGIRPYYEEEDEVTEKDLESIRAIVREEVGKTPVRVWSYRNDKYESVDAYRIMRDVRDATVGTPEGKPTDTTAAKTSRIKQIHDLAKQILNLVRQAIKQLQ